MNFSLNIKPHLEIILAWLCMFIFLSTFGIVVVRPKGHDKFGEVPVNIGMSLGVISTLALYGYLGFRLVVWMFFPS